jgi:hypothetical protein
MYNKKLCYNANSHEKPSQEKRVRQVLDLTPLRSEVFGHVVLPPSLSHNTWLLTQPDTNNLKPALVLNLQCEVPGVVVPG